MVERRLNEPVLRIDGQPVFWLTQKPTTVWTCSRCHVEQPKNSIAVEVALKRSERLSDFMRKEMGREYLDRAIQKYLCLDCAIEAFDDVVLKCRLLKNKGVQGFRLIEEM